jgi:AraC-like DNA-binding protein
VSGLHPAVAFALARFQEAATVRDVVAASGYSHRHFVELFRQAVGLTPKLYCRVQRFVKALSRLGAKPNPSSADLAIAAGYSDQAHFNREFLEVAGVTPGLYRRIAPSFPSHVPLVNIHDCQQPRSILFNTSTGGESHTD